MGTGGLGPPCRSVPRPPNPLLRDDRETLTRPAVSHAVSRLDRMLIPRVGPPSPSCFQCYDHGLYGGTQFLLLELIFSRAASWSSGSPHPAGHRARRTASMNANANCAAKTAATNC